MPVPKIGFFCITLATPQAPSKSCLPIMPGSSKMLAQQQEVDRNHLAVTVNKAIASVPVSLSRCVSASAHKAPAAFFQKAAVLSLLFRRCLALSHGRGDCKERVAQVLPGTLPSSNGSGRGTGRVLEFAATTRQHETPFYLLTPARALPTDHRLPDRFTTELSSSPASQRKHCLCSLLHVWTAPNSWGARRGSLPRLQSAKD